MENLSNIIDLVEKSEVVYFARSHYSDLATRCWDLVHNFEGNEVAIEYKEISDRFESVPGLNHSSIEREMAVSKIRFAANSGDLQQYASKIQIIGCLECLNYLCKIGRIPILLEDTVRRSILNFKQSI